MYHHIARQAGPNAVSTAAWEAQMAFLHAGGYHVLAMDAYLAKVRAGTLDGRDLAITFDDAYCSFTEHALPVLQRWGFPATVYVPVDHVGRSNVWDDGAYPILDWAGLRALSHVPGVTIGAHSSSHRRMRQLDDTTLAAEVTTSKAVLERELGRPVLHFSYPYGQLRDYDRRCLRAVAEAGFASAVSTIWSRRNGPQDLYALHRLEITPEDDTASFAAKLQRPFHPRWIRQRVKNLLFHLYLRR